ncbi:MULTISPECIES: cupin domain-containing protein [Intestinimonas]|jgi:ethanolamine utilization protein EutQ|uniref:Cupin domain-containing protein n=1 Tax=Intestinimonas massiliensis (ex Afouda et al. 2020) TaxID=1673721 RepID=A0AAW5JGU9_9FIRM|nr:MULTISPECIES: cupin domain-containing protein [Intestinimonas]MDU1323893.1 cupin domain-containing protein [Clostridiales bacterium]CUQ20453.1 ethanolamine utilization protein EutQ [Flavonifractor plautii]SCJ07691.1 Ethanolamine utilization protein eutQ [uncultured Flavonifractor sp.]BDE88765.1 ethanolamine utilization protein EutQ [Oscillospiraceae bacterium]MCG4525768.1 cupin domain-containing protein [Intestinimonas massiliensis (ex Afouda et al. 2020)]
MAERDRAAIEELVRRVLLEKLGGNGPRVKKVEVPRLDVAAEHRMDTGNPADRVWTRDLFTLEEAPRLGCGLMVMERTTFPWTLTYDEMDYVIEGRLDILVDGQTVSAGPGEVLYIPKDTSIQFSVRDKARFLYFVYPANWQN